MSNFGQDGGDSSSENNPAQVREASESEIHHDHGDRPLAQDDRARIWGHASLDGVELFHGSYRNYQFARHFHRVPAIGVVDRGTMSSYCRRAQHVLGTGTVLLFNPGEIHAPASAEPSGWSFRMFYLEEELFQSIAQNFSMPDLRFRQPFVQDNELSSCLFQLHHELEEDGDRLRFESLLLSAFSRLAERHSEVVGHTSQLRTDKAKIDAARQYLEAHYDRNLSLTELAEVSSLSPSHFLRMFRDTVGLTPHAYLTQFRIEYATSLLRIGTPLVDVAHLVGFTDQSHFTKKFKRILGVTPGQYTLNSRSDRRRGNSRSRRSWFADLNCR